MKTIFVTGGSGFIGSHVVNQLISIGHKVIVFDSFTHYAFPISPQIFDNFANRFRNIQDKLQIVRSSTEYYEYLRKSVHNYRPDIIIHLASMPLANMAIEHPDEAVLSIMNGTVNVLKSAADAKCVQRIVYISSSMVYGNFSQDPISEEHTKNPTEIYGSLKLSGELIVKSFCGLNNIEYTIVRPSAVYGPTDNNKRVLEIFLRNALDGKPLVVKGADRFLDFTYVEDTAAGIVLAALKEKGANNIFNITRGQKRSIIEAATIIKELVPQTIIEVTAPESWSPARGTLDISKARELLGYNPTIDLEKGLELYLGYLKEQKERCKDRI
ncbi:MAG: NAD(P)-dependent oxidoreductase [Oligoflexia bacterium]|nr:NAD(P)-dependent oxidoreductase [Oligoflexia bacterium]